MGFLRDIFRAFFCKPKKQEELDKTNIEQPYMQVVHKKEQQEIQNEVNHVCNEVKNEVNISSSNKPKIFNTKREKLINHLLETSSGISKSQASEKFKINRLDTMVYNLRKKGYVFETSHSVGNIYLYYLISTPKK
jgi:hypothetical protein